MEMNKIIYTVRSNGYSLETILKVCMYNLLNSSIIRYCIWITNISNNYDRYRVKFIIACEHYNINKQPFSLCQNLEQWICLSFKKFELKFEIKIFNKKHINSLGVYI